MKTDVLGRIVLLAALAVGITLLSDRVSEAQWKNEAAAVVLRRGEMRCGFERVFAYLDWMRLAQFRAEMDSQHPTGPIEKAIYRRFDEVTDLDPFMMAAYKQGAMELQTGAPGDAIQLLRKGMEVPSDVGNDLKLMASVIAMRYLNDDKVTLDLLDTALADPDHRPTVETMWVIVKAKGTHDNPVILAALWRDVGKVGVLGSAAATGNSPDGGQLATVSPLAREKIVGILGDVRSQSRECTEAERPALLSEASDIEKILREVGAGNAEDISLLRINALVAMARIAPSSNEVLAALTGAMRHGPPDMGTAAAAGIIKAAPDSDAARESMAALRKALKSREVSTRLLAARALGSLGPQGNAAMPELIDALGDEEPRVAAAAAEALGAMGPEASGALGALQHVVSQQ